MHHETRPLLPARSAHPLTRWLGLLCLAALLGGCASPRTLLLHGVADTLAAQPQADEDDLELARDASPFYLKLSESVLRQTPEHAALAESVAAGFTQYAYAFVAFEADRLESTDARAARQLRERAARLYARAHHHAMAALERGQPGLARALAQRAGAELPVLGADQAGLAYWAAASWAARIALSTDRPDVVADLPAAIRLAGLAYAVDPDHGQGALASLMGTLEASRPGGSAARARALFERAQAAAAGRNAGVFVSMAESLALAAGDRVSFESLLRQAVAVADAEPGLGNRVMRARALWLLETVDDRF